MTPATTQHSTNAGAAPPACNAAEWHRLTLQEALNALGSGPVGLSPDESRRRLSEYGFNELRFKRRSALIRFLVQLHHPLIYVLLAAATVCAALTLLTGEDMWSEVNITHGATVDTHLVTQAQTAAFMSVMWVHLGFLFTARRIQETQLKLNPFSDRWIITGAALTLACQLALTYVPTLQGLFRTAAFPASWWWLVAAGAIPGFFLVEFDKYIRRNRGSRAGAMPA